MTSHIVIHVPHAKTHIPAGEADRLLLNRHGQDQELLKITDWFVDEIFHVPPETATTVAFTHSRLLVDPERFEDDNREPMAEQGMGAVYTRTSHGAPLRPDLSTGERQRLLEAYYHPHHIRLDSAVSDSLGVHGHCLIIDAHSFPSSPLPCDLDQISDRPDFCIGTDPFHTPTGSTSEAKEFFEGRGFSVLVDRPYSGSLVPTAFFRRNRRVHSIMLEVNRRLYMDEKTGDKLDAFEKVGELVRTWIFEVNASFPRATKEVAP